MPAGGLLTAGIGAAVGLGESIYGGIKAKKLNNQLTANAANRPKYQIPQEETDIENLAASRAGQGLSDVALTANQNQINQNTAASLSAIKQGGDTSRIGGITGAADNAAGQLATYDNKAAMGNLSNLYGSYQRMSANKDKQWQLNQQDPWKDQQQFLSSQLAGAKNMEQSGINTAASGLMGIGSSLLKGNTNSNPASKMYFGGLPTSSPSPLPVSNDVPALIPSGGYNIGLPPVTPEPLGFPATNASSMNLGGGATSGFY